MTRNEMLQKRYEQRRQRPSEAELKRRAKRRIPLPKPEPTND